MSSTNHRRSCRRSSPARTTLRWYACATLLLAACGESETSLASAATLPSEVAVPTAIQPSGRLNVAPPPGDEQYLRCGTYAGETVWHTQPSPRHAYLAARTNAGTVRLIATEPWREIAELAFAIGAIESVAFSPDERLLATLSTEAGQLVLWNTHDGSLARVITLSQPSTSYWRWDGTIDFSPDGARLASSMHTITNVETGETTDVTGAPLNTPSNRWPSHDVVRFGHGGQQLITITRSQAGSNISRQAVQWLLGKEKGKVLDGRQLFSGFSFSRDLTMFGVSSREAPTLVYDLRSGGLAPEPVRIQTAAPLLALSNDGKHTYQRAGDDVVTYDVASQQPIGRFSWLPPARFLGISPRGHLVAASERDTTWWDPATGSAVRTVGEVLTEVSWSADGLMGTGSGPTALLRVWRESDGVDLLRLPPKKLRHARAACTPDAVPSGP
jgi:hypothetical protein